MVGKSSCCAYGGSWFKKCGNIGDTNFDHTWAEGIQSCKNSPISVSVKSALKVMLRYKKVVVHPQSINRSQNVTHQANISLSGVISKPDITGFDSGVAFGKIDVYICVLLMTLHSWT